jgi:hypothetical protein
VTTCLCCHLLHFKQKQKNKRRRWWPWPSSSSSQVEEKKKKHREKKKFREGRELTFLLSLMCLGWNTPFTFSSPCSFNVELSTFLKPCVLCLLEALSYSSWGALPSSSDGMSGKWGEGGRRGEVGRRGKFWGRKEGWKILG